MSGMLIFVCIFAKLETGSYKAPVWSILRKSDGLPYRKLQKPHPQLRGYDSYSPVPGFAAAERHVKWHIPSHTIITSTVQNRHIFVGMQRLLVSKLGAKPHVRPSRHFGRTVGQGIHAQNGNAPIPRAPRQGILLPLLWCQPIQNACHRGHYSNAPASGPRPVSFWTRRVSASNQSHYDGLGGQHSRRVSSILLCADGNTCHRT
jgi:hypothetical protein